MSIFENMDLTRRHFVQRAAGTFLGVSCMNNLSAAAGNTVKVSGSGSAKSVIYLYMSGGMSHLDSFDIKPENKEVCGNAGLIGLRKKRQPLSYNM